MGCCVSDVTCEGDGSKPFRVGSVLRFYLWLELAYLAFKKTCIHTKGTEEGFTNIRFFKEML